MKALLPKRGYDKFGSGSFGAKRGKRKHRGQDFNCPKGSIILSPVKGVVTKIGFPYDYKIKAKRHFRYVQITEHKTGRRFRFFYILPSLAVGDKVKIDDQIGKSQGLLRVYPGIDDHIHVEIKELNGIYNDPNPYLQ